MEPEWTLAADPVVNGCEHFSTIWFPLRTHSGVVTKWGEVAFDWTQPTNSSLLHKSHLASGGLEVPNQIEKAWAFDILHRCERGSSMVPDLSIRE